MRHQQVEAALSHTAAAESGLRFAALNLCQARAPQEVLDAAQRVFEALHAFKGAVNAWGKSIARPGPSAGPPDVQ